MPLFSVFFRTFALQFAHYFMTYLLIETSATICTLALAEDDEIICSFRNDEPMHHATSLPVFAQQALDTARQRGLKIDVVAVSGGPGSYTGLRIGVSTAKGICYATGARLVQVSTLQLIARRFLGNEDAACRVSTQQGQPVIRPMIDARRMEVYTQAFDAQGDPIDDPQALVITPDSFSDINDTLYICGSGAAKCRDVITSPNVKIADDIEPEADADMLLLAQKAVAENRFEDVAYYEPFYLKEFYTTAKPMK